LLPQEEKAKTAEEAAAEEAAELKVPGGVS
jgi:hypothetical protein